MPRAKNTNSVETLRDQIRATGLRVTAPRVAVLQRVLYVSSGVGQSIVPLRFRVPPEVNLLRVRP